MFTIFPVQVFARQEPLSPPAGNAEMLESQNKKDKIVGEVIEKREKNIKSFLREDLTYEADVYNSAVHFLENGEWVDIDNTLDEKTDEDKNPILENKRNEYKVKLAKNTNSSKLVRIGKGDYEISWNIDNPNKADAAIVAGGEVSLDNLSENDRKRVLPKLSSSVNYLNIYDNVDLRYDIRPEEVKEIIIIKDKTENLTFKFNLNTMKLVPKVLKDGAIVFYDEKDSSKEIFKINAPFMYDSNEEYSSKVSMTLESSGNGYLLTLSPDSEWINSPDRKFPIYVDPWVETSLARADIKDAYVSQASPGTNYKLSGIMKIGYGSTTLIDRAYIRFNLPSLTPADMVTDAYLQLCMSTANSNARQINAHRVLAAWDSGTITWNNAPGFNSKIEEYALPQGSAGTFAKWNITGMVKDWYSTGINNGVLLKNQDETVGFNEFYSSDNTTAPESSRPQVIIHYVSNLGLEGYWTYHSQSAGRAGSGYINDYNGNLVYIHNDIMMNGNRMPVSISHVYNSAELKDRDMSKPWIGRGWKLNIYQEVERKLIGSLWYWVLTDEDNTKIYFKDDGSNNLKDELNLGYTLSLDSSKQATIKDKSDTQLKFDQGGYITSIVDQHGNSIRFNYSYSTGSNTKIISSVVDGAGRITNLIYDSNGILNAIKDPSGRSTVFQYDPGTNWQTLKKIIYPDGLYAIFDYDASYNLTGVTNIDGNKINYEYTTALPKRVKRTYESNGTTLGEELNLTYAFNRTDFTDSQGRKVTYLFDNYGKTVSIKDSDGSAAYYSYRDSSNITRIGQESKLQKSIINYLRNHEAEIDDTWYSAGTGVSYSTEEKYIGSRSIKLLSDSDLGDRYFAQYVSLKKGKTYTLSGYIKTKDITVKSNAGAALTLAYQDAAGVWKYQRKFISGTSDWDRYEVSIDMPSDASNSNLWVAVEILDAKGTAYFDSLQLEDGPIANRYNIIENPDFIYGPETPAFWTKNADCSTSDIRTSITDALHPAIMSNDVLKVSGVANKTKNIWQNIKISGKKGESFVFGGWAKGDSVPISSGRTFKLTIGVVRTDGSYQWADAYFNEDSSEWQFTSSAFVTDSDYTTIYIWMMYYNNCNNVYFDGIQLYRETFGQSYQYDSNGNVVSTADLAKQQSQFQYNGNNDLIKSVNAKGSEFKYEYDRSNPDATRKHNLLKATSAENVVYSFDYDSYGNPKYARVGDSTLFIKSTSEYTADGNYIKSLTDSSGNVVNYNYNTTKGVLDSVTDANQKTTSYVYDDMLDRLKSVSKTADGKEITNSYTYLNDRIETINHYGASYRFGYDSFGNNITVSVGTQNLITNAYEPKTGLILESTYGNGQKVGSDYDDLDRVIARKYQGSVRYSYAYDASGNLGYQDDRVNNNRYRYIYDLSDRLVKIDESSGNSVEFIYDTDNNMQRVNETIGNKNYSTNYSFDRDNRPTSVMYNRDTTGIYSKIENSLIAYYSFDNNDISDSSGRGNTGSTQGSVQFVDGYRGKAAKLNGIDNYIELTDFAVPKNFTVSMWIKPEDITKNQYLVGKHRTDGGNIFLVGFWNGLYNVAVRSWEYSSGTVTGLNTFQHIVVVVNEISSSSSQIKFYKDNSLLWTSTVDGAVGNASGKNWVLGQDWDGTTPSDFYKGLIDEVSFYNRELTADEISALFNMTSGLNNITYRYDALGRLTANSINTGSYTFTNNYIYEPGIEGSTTTRVKSFSNNAASISYTYDNNGNIKTILTDGNPDTKIQYFYNELNELVREDNGVLGKTIEYLYDAGGNILSKSEYPYTTSAEPGTPTATYTYSYTDGNWKDKLTGYTSNGVTKEISYDNIGNPLNYDGWTFKWEQGRQLESMNKTDTSISFKYNDSGIRTEKNVNGVVTKYRLVGDRVTFETNGTDSIYYTYDSSNNLVSMNLNGVEYYYIRNAQGDITGLFDKSGTKVVTYTYDSWGKLISITGSYASTVGEKNPYRYRGYRYDTETGLYYLNSRYYNPEWGRFINADGIVGQTGQLLGHNLFAYCFNNPINMEDSNGYLPTWLKGLATVAVTLVAVAVVVVAAPVAACAIGTGLALATGASAVTATAITSVATVGAYTVAGSVFAFGANRAYEDVTGKNVLKDTVFQGNEDAYNTAETVVNMVGDLIVGTAAASPGGSCFVAGTKISTADGEKPIEEIKPGDMVYAYNEETGEVGLKPVVQTFVRESNELVHLKVDGQIIDTTSEHPFYVPQKGWTEAIRLRAGDKLLLRSGKIVIVEAIQHEILESPVKVYNFEVEDWHTYFVSVSGVLVHNACSNPGRSGKQARLKQLVDDDKLSSALRGEIRRDLNEIARGNRTNIRVPFGYNLAHRRGFEAKFGFGYNFSDLQDIGLHRLQHHREGY